MFRQLISELSKKVVEESSAGNTKEEDSKKRKAESEPAEEPSAKEVKKDAEVVEPSKNEENETSDVQLDTRPTLRQTVSFAASDTTLNVIPTAAGSRVLLTPFSEGGIQHLLAGARANVGITAGCYMYEVKVLETLNPEDLGTPDPRKPKPRQLVRIGFSTSDSHLISPQENDKAVLIDSDQGCFVGNAPRKSMGARWSRNDVVGVVLDLTADSKDSNSISFYRNGKRFGLPVSLPESLKGRPLFPHIIYRNATVLCNFGPEILGNAAEAESVASTLKLPSSIRMLGRAAEADTEVRSSCLRSDGKFEVLFPIAVPDQGTFRWLDKFLQDNPHYVELSDRMLADWITRSGMSRVGNVGQNKSNDRPSFNFGIPSLEDYKVQGLLKTVASLVPRDYIVMEVRENLIKRCRKEALARFNSTSFKKVARIVMGEPNEQHKQIVQAHLLQEKKIQAKADWTKKQALKKILKTQRAVRAKQEAQKAEKEKRAAAAKAILEKKRAETQKKMAENQKKMADIAAEFKAKQEAEAKKEGEEEEKEDKAEKVDTEGTEEKKDEDDGKDKDDAEGKEEIDKAEADPEGESEKKADSTMEAPADGKADDAVDTQKAEETGQKVEEAEESEEETAPPEVELTEEDKAIWFVPSDTKDLTEQVFARYLRFFCLPEPDEGFDDIQYEWQGAEKSKEALDQYLSDHKVVTFFEDIVYSPVLKEHYPKWIKQLTEWHAAGKNFAEKQEKGSEIVRPDNWHLNFDVDRVENVCDIGNGTPLFVDWEKEDWALLNLRYEFFLLYDVYRIETEGYCPGIHESNLMAYYTKFYCRPLLAKNYGFESGQKVLDLLKDTVKFDENSCLVTPLSSEVNSSSFDAFVKLTEQARRVRQKNIDIGDEGAKLNFLPVVCNPPLLSRVSQILAQIAASAAHKDKTAGIR